MIDVKGTRSDQAKVDPNDPLDLRKPEGGSAKFIAGWLGGLIGLGLYLRSFLWSEAEAAFVPEDAVPDSEDSDADEGAAPRGKAVIAATKEEQTAEQGGGDAAAADEPKAGPLVFPAVLGPFDTLFFVPHPVSIIGAELPRGAANASLPPFRWLGELDASHLNASARGTNAPGVAATYGGQPMISPPVASNETNPPKDTDDPDETRNRAPRNTGPVYLKDVGSGAAVGFALSYFLSQTSDPDGAPLNVSMGASTSGTLEPKGEGWRYLADTDFLGEVRIDYTITDGVFEVAQTAFLNVVENVFTGGDGDDLIVGTRGRDVMDGQAGDDNLAGLGGRDRIFGGDGKDYIAGGDGDDSLSGGDGDDLIVGGAGDDWISGGAGQDRLYGEAGDDEIHGDAGDDEAYGGAGNDTIAGGDGDDAIRGGADNDLLSGDAGRDKLFGDVGDDVIYAGTGNDTASGGEGNDLIFGGEDDDLLNGDEGNDVLMGDTGRDELFGDVGDDVIYAGAGNDTASGGEGNDLLFGGEDDDQLNGDEGNDVLMGDAGRDELFGGDGDDILAGGEGEDTIGGGDGDDAIRGGAGNDLLSGDTGRDELFGDVGDDVIYAGTGNDTASGGEGNDLLFGGEDDDQLNGDEGNDILMGDAGRDELFGGDGDDILAGGEGEDTVAGDGGDDLVIVGDDGVSDHHDGGEGHDRLDYSAATKAVSFDLTDGTVSGESTGTDEFENFEHFTGTAEADIFHAGGGQAKLTGGGGADLYSFVQGDTVDFIRSMYQITDFDSDDEIWIGMGANQRQIRDAQRSIEDRLEDGLEDYADSIGADEPRLSYHHDWTDTYRMTVIEVDFDRDRIVDLDLVLEGEHFFAIEHV